MTRRFSAQVRDWAERTKAGMTAVARDAIQDVVDTANMPAVDEHGNATGGLMPVDTGTLRNSITAEGGGGGEAAVAVSIEGFEPGDVLRVGWTAAYARRIEAGFTGTDALGRSYNQPGRFFLTTAAARFQEFVDAAAEKHKP